ncbi:MAG: site-specific DNA-methyltransferase [Bacteroidia bacterium]|nr:site-specific DNA-methyltransferase [Bacteroidia bacterium]
MDTKQIITTEIKIPNKDLETLKNCFPQYFDKNGNFDFEKFKNYLTEKEINFSAESYGLEWLGKSYARLLASDPATTLLKADEAHNGKPENQHAENLLIKGDNLEVLKHLANAYYEKVKMIYIDPPYNTGNDGFVYNDDRKYTVEELQNLLGIDEEKAKRILSFTQSKSNSHSAWLTFMYPRLYIARQLLREDGVIFVSIDDNEVAQLRLLMDDIFGEENFVANAIVISNRGGRDYGGIARQHDYILIYSRSNDYEINLIDEAEKKFQYTDEIGGFNLVELRNRNIKFNNKNRPNLFYPFYVNPNNPDKFGLLEVSMEPLDGYIEVYPVISQGVQTVWRWGKDKAAQNINKVIFGKKKQDGGFMIVQKYRKTEKMQRSILDDKEFVNERGTEYIKKLFKEVYFDYPKSISLIKRTIELGANEDSTILDFFAGSGTTGDAVMQLNAEDGGNRKFILVQLPEPIDPKKNKTAYDFVQKELKAEPTIFEITKERLIRAAKKINSELDSKIDTLKKELPTDETKDEIEKLERLKKQNAFKIFETMPIWEDYDFEAEQFDPSQTLFDAGKLTEEDLKALLTTWKTYDGIPLTQDLESIDLDGYTAHYGNSKLYLMHKGFTTEHLKALLVKTDTDKHFEPRTVIAFGYHFESARLRELAENLKSYNNRKKTDIEFVVRY